MAEGHNCANSQEEQANGQCAKLQACLITLGYCQVNGKDDHEQTQILGSGQQHHPRVSSWFPAGKKHTGRASKRFTEIVRRPAKERTDNHCRSRLQGGL